MTICRPWKPKCRLKNKIPKLNVMLYNQSYNVRRNSTYISELLSHNFMRAFNNVNAALTIMFHSVAYIL